MPQGDGAGQGSKCDRCEGPAAYVRKYSGERLCSACFSGSIEKKTAKTVSKHGMIRRGELVAVAVSGGKDSLALLKIISGMGRAHGFGVKAITIDEGIPGYRDEALEIVKEFCSELGVEYRAYSYADLFGMTLDGALEMRDGDRTSSCAICGTLRRRAIDHAAADIGADVIATGHNLDDVLQTFLINMLSGDTGKIGWMGHGAPREGRPRKVKPFCEIYESEIVFYAFANDIPFQTEPCPHMDEGIRTEIREFLNSLEGRHSGVKNSLYQSVLRVSGAVRGSSSTKERRECGRCGSECTGTVCSACSMVLRLGGGQT